MFFSESEIGDHSYLESCVIHGAKGKLWNYDSLPTTISSLGIESYANWVMGLTQNDSEQRERAANIYLRFTPLEILYPLKPRLGDKTSVGPENLLRSDRMRILIFLHSHSYTSSFSDSDIGKILFLQSQAYKKYRVIAEIVTSPEYNFLLLTTNQTFQVFHDFPIEDFSEKVFSEYYQLVQASGIKSLPENKFGVRRFNPEWKPKYNFLHYCYTLFLSLMADKVYKLGFYYSTRNGLYNLVRSMTLEKLTGIQSERKDFILKNFYHQLSETKPTFTSTNIVTIDNIPESYLDLNH